MCRFPPCLPMIVATAIAFAPVWTTVSKAESKDATMSSNEDLVKAGFDRWRNEQFVEKRGA